MPEIISRKAAKARGLKRFFTGKPCYCGHVSERRVSNNSCIECEKNPLRIRAPRDWELKFYAERERKARELATERKRKIADLIVVLREEMPDLLKEFGL